MTFEEFYSLKYGRITQSEKVNGVAEVMDRILNTVPEYIDWKVDQKVQEMEFIHEFQIELKREEVLVTKEFIPNPGSEIKIIDWSKLYGSFK